MRQRQAHNTHGNGDIGTSVPIPARSVASTRHHHPRDIALSLTHMSCHSSPLVLLPSSSRNDTHGSRTYGTSDHGTEDDARTSALGACTNPRFRGFQKFMYTCAQGDLRNTANDTFAHTSSLCRVSKLLVLMLSMYSAGFNWFCSGHFIRKSFTGLGHDNLLIYFFVALRSHATCFAIAGGFRPIPCNRSTNIWRRSQL